MEPGITWYDVLGVLPGAAAEKIKDRYTERVGLLRPELISGAPSNVLVAVSRAQHFLDAAWEVLGEPASRTGYDEAAGLRGGGGSLTRPEPFPSDPRLDPSDTGFAHALGADLLAGLLMLTDWLGPHPRQPSRVPAPDVRGLFYDVCLEVTGRLGFHLKTVRLTPHPMPVDGLVVDQSPRAPGKLQRSGVLTVQVWHPPARSC